MSDMFPEDGCGCDASEVQPGLLTLDAALDECRQAVRVLRETEIVPLADAPGRHLAGSLISWTNVPPFANSAMDGYALSSDALKGPGPWLLPVTDRVAAGDAPPSLKPGHAARIFTGAPLPAGADTVIAQEEARVDAGMMRLDRAPAPGTNVRSAGEDMAAGDAVLGQGHALTRRDVALAAATGAGRLTVRRRVRIAILVSGAELKQAGEPLDPGMIRDVNGPMLNALLDRADVELLTRECVGDDPAAIADALRRLSQEADLVVTTGGVSVGDEDHLRRTVVAAGGRLRFGGVAIKPGKPISLGHIGDALWLGLPGNPVAAFVGWHLFGQTLLRGLQGASTSVERQLVSALAPITHRPGRCELRPARLAGHDGQGRQLVNCGDATHSARVRPLAEADGLVLIPAQTETLAAGDLAEFFPFHHM